MLNTMIQNKPFLLINFISLFNLNIYAENINIELGSWWITETALMVDVSPLESGPIIYEKRTLQHKWLVAGEGEHSGIDCWIIEIYAYNLPSEVENSHVDSWLFKLWLSKNNLSLKHYEGNYRHGMHLVTGDTLITNALTISHEQAVIIPWVHACPLSFPLFSRNWFDHEINDADKMLTFKDEKTNHPIVQTAEKMIDDKTGRVEITTMLFFQNELRIHKWSNECTWWMSFERQANQPKQHGLIYSKTIEWKGKRKE